MLMLLTEIINSRLFETGHPLPAPFTPMPNPGDDVEPCAHWLLQ